ncbi:MAG: hypothetical protein WBQ21_11685 [Solirubrobacteraceae bacterium]
MVRHGQSPARTRRRPVCAGSQWFVSTVLVRATIAAAVLVVTALPTTALASPSGTIDFSIAGSATAEVPFSISVSGTSSLEGTLLVYVFSGSPGCPVSASEVQGGDLHNEGGVSAGSYSKSLGEDLGVGSYTLCGYLTDSGSTYATGTDMFQVAPTPPPTPSPAPPEPSAPTPTPTPAAAHLTTLSVTTRSHAGSTASKPGETELLVTVTPDAVLRVVLKRQGHTLAKRVSVGARPSGKIIVPWSCSAPGGVYSYAITATDAYGASLTRTGRFRPVSAARCRALRKTDERRRSAEAREHHEQEEERRHEGHETEHEDERVRSDQRAYCEQVLGGNVEQVFNGNMIPTVPSEIETECSAHGRNYTLRGDPPVVVNETP